MIASIAPAAKPNEIGSTLGHVLQADGDDHENAEPGGALA